MANIFTENKGTVSVADHVWDVLGITLLAVSNTIISSPLFSGIAWTLGSLVALSSIINHTIQALSANETRIKERRANKNAEKTTNDKK